MNAKSFLTTPAHRLPVAQKREEAARHIEESLHREQRLTPDLLAILTALRVQSTISCACCGGKIGIYHRSIYDYMAATLIWMMRNSSGWMSIPESAPRYAVNNRDYSKFVYWGILESRPNTDPSKKDSGQWRVTPVGVAFATRARSVPKKLWIYQNTAYARSVEEITVVEALGERFNYAELMA